MFPPAVVRQGYERGYFQPPPSSAAGWYHRRIFIPTIDPPGLNGREKKGLQALVDDLTGDQSTLGKYNQHSSLQQVYDRFSLHGSRIGALAVMLGITLGEVDPPEFDANSVQLPAPRELEAVAWAACGLGVAGVARAMQISEKTSNVLLGRARQKLKVHHLSAGIARLFAMGVFIKGRLTKNL